VFKYSGSLHLIANERGHYRVDLFSDYLNGTTDQSSVHMDPSGTNEARPLICRAYFVNALPTGYLVEKITGISGPATFWRVVSEIPG
ncbi:MAG: hypothetical protein AAB212_08965, partial [Bacteroidota bacterium]